MRRGRFAKWVGGFLGAAVFAVGLVSAAGPVRLVAAVPETFVVNGKVYPPGPLRIDQRRDFTPTTSLDAVGVGPSTLGMFLASTIDAESRERDYVVFQRDGAGRMVLVGYVLTSSTGSRAYRYPFHDPGVAEVRLPAAR